MAGQASPVGDAVLAATTNGNRLEWLDTGNNPLGSAFTEQTEDF